MGQRQVSLEIYEGLRVRNFDGIRAQA